MAWTNPGTPNLADFFAYAYSQGIPSVDLPLPVLSVTGGGSGYTEAPVVTIAPPSVGLGMTAVATVSSGAVTGLTAVFPGTNYAALPTLTIAAPASGVQATGVVTSLASPYPAQALNSSLDRTINPVGPGPAILGELSPYTTACYNLAMHLLLLFAQDHVFTRLRTQFELNRFRPGIVMASGDQATSQTFIVPQFFQTITLDALEATRTPWGRAWVSWQQMYGPTVWGMS